MSRQKTPKEFEQEIYNLVGDEYTVLTPYVKSKTKLKMRHNKCGYEYMVRPNDFLNGHRCPKCRGVYKPTTEQFKQKVYNLVGNEYTVVGEYINTMTKIKMRHNVCGKVNEYIPNNFLRGSRCFNCSYKKRSKELRKSLLEFKRDVFNLVGNEYTVIGDYVNSKTPIAIRHNKCGYISHIRPNDFICRDIRCHKCNSSRGEQLLAKSLTAHNVKYVSQKRFSDCINPKTGYKLPFDFYIPLYRVCIEFDGIQHFKPVNHFGGKTAFKSLRYRDKLKTDYCNNHGIKLIRINYNNIDEIETIIRALQLFEYSWITIINQDICKKEMEVDSYDY